MSRPTLVVTSLIFLQIRDFHPLWLSIPTHSSCDQTTDVTPYPSKLVWAVPLSLATTYGIDLSFFSSRYFDVSVPWVTSYGLCVGP